MEAREEQVYRRLHHWSQSVAIEGRLSGGNRNTVWSVRVAGKRYAARLSARPPEALEWELRLLERLHRAGMLVPEVLPSGDGRLYVDGLSLFGWIEGRPPDSHRDWNLVLEELRRLHTLTRDLPQRPHFRSSQDLLLEERGGDVRLDMVPDDVVSVVREAWRPLAGESTSAVHGDPGRGNILIQGNRVGLIDWDEARVDVSLLDLAALPLDTIPDVSPGCLHAARRAGLAWEVANGWLAEPEYARRRLRELLAPDGHHPRGLEGNERE